MARKRTLFINSWTRRQRIEAILKRHEWTWYQLSKVMSRNQSAVQKAFKVDRGQPQVNPTLPMLKACARALGISVGFLVDVKDVCRCGKVKK